MESISYISTVTMRDMKEKDNEKPLVVINYIFNTK
jgi:hypothetical protein